MKRVFLVRHGEMGNPTGTLAGPDGYPLSARGREQVAALAEAFLDAGVARVVSSPVRRARETAAILAERLSVPVEEDPRLGEWGMGRWVGRPLAEFYAGSGHFRRPMRLESDMEPLADAATRVIAVADAVRASLADGEAAVLVGHREPLVAALLAARGTSFDAIHDVDLPVASAWEIVYEDGAEPRVAKFADAHAAR